MPVSRRTFLPGAFAAPAVVPRAVLGLNGAVPPSDRVTLGVIGLGARSLRVLGHFLSQLDVHVPVEFGGEGQILPPGGINETPYFYRVRARYRNGVRLYAGAGPKGVRFDGDDG